MTPAKQLEEWIKGNSIHNDVRDECCPDFSCCLPDLLVDKQLRIKFLELYKANDQEGMFGMLGMFLGGCIAKASPDKKVYIYGDGAIPNDMDQL